MINFFTPASDRKDFNPSSTQSKQGLRSKLTKISPAVQLVVIITCVVLAGLFFRDCTKKVVRSRKTNVSFIVLCSNMFLILIRCTYRLVEHMGNVGLDISDIESLRQLIPVLHSKWFFYVFESTRMLLNPVIWNIWHPGRYMPRLHNIYLSPDGSELRL
jgi:hypothetical protein